MAGQYRQGDVLLVPVQSIPEGLLKKETRGDRCVVAEGEATGHAHTLDAEVATIWTAGEEVAFLSVLRDAVLEHQEHSKIDVPAGTYRIVHQVEYAPQEIRRVAD